LLVFFRTEEEVDTGWSSPLLSSVWGHSKTRGSNQSLSDRTREAGEIVNQVRMSI